MPAIAISELSAALAPHGLMMRGSFELGSEDALSGMIVLVGSAGDGWSQPFQNWFSRQHGSIENPLDSWTREIVGALADAYGARLVMPNDRPYAPFQQWAMRAEGLRASPIGILIHPEYGLWHSYRAALLFEAPLPEKVNQQLEKPIHPCDACIGKPCLNACPVGAHSLSGFDHAACLGHVRGGQGSDCRAQGCFSRNACPVGTGWRFRPETQAFLQHAFAGPL